MDEAGVVVAIVNALNAVNIPHMLDGSLSSNAYGIPRSTKDADLVIQLGSNSLSQLLQPAAGIPTGITNWLRDDHVHHAVSHAL